MENLTKIHVETIEETNLSLSKIKLDLQQPRQYFDKKKIEILQQSINVNGLFNRLVVFPLSKDKKFYFLIDGHRRYQALKNLGLKEAPVRVVRKLDKKELDIFRFELHETHEDWTPTEKANAILRMQKAYSWTISQLSENLSISPATVNNYLAISKLSQEAQEISRKHNVKTSYHIEMINALRHLKGKIREEMNDPEKTLMEKITTNVIKSPIEFRKLKKIFKDNKVDIIRKFFKDKNFSIDEAYELSALRSGDIIKDIEKLSSNLKDALREAMKMQIYVIDQEIYNDLDDIRFIINEFEKQMIKFGKVKIK